MGPTDGELRALVADLERAQAKATELSRAVDRDRSAWDEWVEATTEWRAAALRVRDWVRRVEEGLVVGDPSAADAALTYLVLDLYYMGSGYTRERIARTLAQVELTDSQRERARTYVLGCVQGRWHNKHPGLSKLAGAVANNALRVQLHVWLHDSDWAVATRALRCMMCIRRPGFDEHDVAAARQIALHRGDWQIARRFWSREWEAELRRLTTFHNDDRAKAKQLLRSAELRDARRERKGRSHP